MTAEVSHGSKSTAILMMIMISMMIMITMIIMIMMIRMVSMMMLVIKGRGSVKYNPEKNDDDNHKMLHYNIFFSIGFPNMNMVSLYIVCTGNVNISLHLSNRVSPPTP